jgi:hypothetical protein
MKFNFCWLNYYNPSGQWIKPKLYEITELFNLNSNSQVNLINPKFFIKLKK